MMICYSLCGLTLPTVPSLPTHSTIVSLSRLVEMKYPRCVYVVRHAEREDNINRNWKKDPKNQGFAHDNSPLSERGRLQAVEVAKRFANEEFSHVFASPFDRTIETAHTIVEGNKNKSLTVKPEPGLCEALYLCEKPFPSFWNAAELKKKFERVDADYDPVFSKHTLPKEGCGDDECVPRLRTTVERITARYEGDLLLVGHGASIGAIHEVITGDFKYVGQATVTKFVEETKGNLKLEYSGCPSHLSDKRNLRPW